MSFPESLGAFSCIAYNKQDVSFAILSCSGGYQFCSESTQDSSPATVLTSKTAGSYDSLLVSKPFGTDATYRAGNMSRIPHISCHVTCVAFICISHIHLPIPHELYHEKRVCQGLACGPKPKKSAKTKSESRRMRMEQRSWSCLNARFPDTWTQEQMLCGLQSQRPTTEKCGSEHGQNNARIRNRAG